MDMQTIIVNKENLSNVVNFINHRLTFRKSVNITLDEDLSEDDNLMYLQQTSLNNLWWKDEKNLYSINDIK